MEKLHPQNSLCLSLGLDVVEHCLKVIFGSLGRDEVPVVPLKRRTAQNRLAGKLPVIAQPCITGHFLPLLILLSSALSPNAQLLLDSESVLPS